MGEKERLQKNMRLIRMTAGWSAEEFGKKLDLTKQTINNLERNDKKYQLSTTQYLAIRYVLNEEINKSKNNKKRDTNMLEDILEIFVDHPEKYEKDVKKEKLLEKANAIAQANMSNNSELTRTDVSLTWEDFIQGIVAVAGAASVATSLAQIIKKR